MSEKSFKQTSRTLRAQQTSERQSNGKRTEDHREDDENHPPSPPLTQPSHSASPSVPPHLPSPSPAPLLTEDGGTDEDVTITLEREAAVPEGKKLLHL